MRNAGMVKFLQNSMNYRIILLMEKIPVNTPENKENFHEVFEKRLELKKLALELGLDVQALEETKNTPEGKIFDTYYKSDFDELNKRASTFKIADFGQKDSSNMEMERLKDALETIKKQKIQYDSHLLENERKILEDQAQIDY